MSTKQGLCGSSITCLAVFLRMRFHGSSSPWIQVLVLVLFHARQFANSRYLYYVAVQDSYTECTFFYKMANLIFST